MLKLHPVIIRSPQICQEHLCCCNDCHGIGHHFKDNVGLFFYNFTTYNPLPVNTH